MTGATGKSFMCKSFMCLFCSLAGCTQSEDSEEKSQGWTCSRSLLQAPCHIKNTTVILIHYGGGKTIRPQQNTTAGSLKHLLFLGGGGGHAQEFSTDSELLRR